LSLQVFVLLSWAVVPAALSAGLKDELGRNEVRVFAAPYSIEVGTSVAGAILPERLDRLGYSRVHTRPKDAGEYFWGTNNFWIYRRAFDHGGDRFDPILLGLELEAGNGEIVGLKLAEGKGRLDLSDFRLEPELLAESLQPNRALRVQLSFDSLPEKVWRPVLAAEDARFFDHSGVDTRSVARAVVKNARAGRVTQGGSTITQQLIKVRDLSPKRTVGRKLSEAARAVLLEARYSKEEILETYLNSIYFGHLEGAELWGLGTAARAFYGKPADRLNLSESIVLAALIQAPNRLHPERHPEALEKRWRWILSRLRDLKWMDERELDRTSAEGLPPLKLQAPSLPPAPHFIAWIAARLQSKRPTSAAVPQGAILESTLDFQLQREAEEALQAGLDRLRSGMSSTRSRQLSAALIAVNSRSGDVLAYVGGDPRRRDDRFDRVRSARRQPGSTIKPLILLEAFESCGSRPPLYPAHRITDRAVRVALPSGTWEPQNPDGRFHGTVTLRQALISSLNIPFVRLAEWCGFDATAKRVRRAGIPLPQAAEKVPASFVLGAVESSPLDIVTSYSTIGSLGQRTEPRPLTQIRLPSGRAVRKIRVSKKRLVGSPAAYLIRDMLQDVVSIGTAKAGRLQGIDLWGKTGTSSGGRDAWMVGGFGDLLAVVWVGLDEGAPAGLSGAGAALPIWRQLVHSAAGHFSTDAPERPRGIVERLVEESTGLVVGRPGSGRRPELFRRGYLPAKRRIWRRDRPTQVIE
jgi:penicillin-binding protein 1B